MPDPLISVIIPAYNAEQYIGTAVGSAQAQTHRSLEILVVDDGSTDGTAAVVEALAASDSRVRLLHQSNQGVAAARNYAIRRSRGEFVAPLDADDLWFPHKLERQLHRMREAGPTAGLVYAWWMYINEDDEIFRLAGRPAVEGHVYVDHLAQNFIGNASVPLFRRRCLKAVGLYDPSLRAIGAEGCEDWDLSLRVAERYGVYVVREHLSGYRFCVRSASADARSMTDDGMAMARSHRVVLDHAQRRHTKIADEVFRTSQANFYNYMATRAYDTGRFTAALYWLGQFVWTDPAALLSPQVWGVAARSAVKGAIRSLLLPLWGRRQDLERVRQWVLNPYLQIRRRRWERLSDPDKRGRTDDGAARPGHSSSRDAPHVEAVSAGGGVAARE